jgi:hypothetical protein
MRAHRVRALLMGGQACVFYGAAEFSRDTDFAILAVAEAFAKVFQLKRGELRWELFTFFLLLTTGKKIPLFILLPLAVASGSLFAWFIWKHG